MDKTFFTHVRSTDKLPIFGFKIHISATWGNYQNITALMLEFLSTRNITYKYIKEAKNVLTNFSTEETTAESGKLFTLYPKTRVECIALLEELYDYLPRDEDGIYILSDRPYKDSKLIFYRYGTFKESLDYLEEGLMTIKGGDGSIWQDYQKSYFDLPIDVEDIQEPLIKTSSHLAKRLKVTEVLKKQNGGNVYQGELLSDSQKIIVKEAVPHIMFNKAITKAELRNREFQRSHHFERFIPQPIEKMSEWINDYYIYHYIGGDKLYEHSTRYSLFGMEASDRSGNVLKFKTFLNIIEKIFDLVSYFHDKNDVIHDIHPDNFRFDEKGELFLIDLEMIYPYGESYIPIQSEIALPSWNKLDGKVADCHKVANMILYLAGKLHTSKDWESNISILEEVAYYFGIESTIGDVILYLLRPDADIKVAQKLLRQVQVKSHDNSITLEDIQEENIVHFKGLSDLIEHLCPQFSLYQANAQNKQMLYCLLDKEKHIGLDGIAGLLFQLKKHYFSEEICEYAISKLLAALREVDRGKSLQFKPGYCSPYLINGSAGAIKVLMTIDCERFDKEILAMADALCFDFAQGPRFLDGMLGCIDALLDVYEWSANPKYLEFAKKQLTICSIYLTHDQLEVADFIYQYQRLRKKTSV